jgi:hypothetical protein
MGDSGLDEETKKRNNNDQLISIAGADDIVF